MASALPGVIAARDEELSFKVVPVPEGRVPLIIPQEHVVKRQADCHWDQFSYVTSFDINVLILYLIPYLTHLK